MAEEQAIPDALLREADALAREWADIELFHDAIPALARALMSAEFRGRQQAEAEMAELLKNPAGVMVNWLRGGINADSVIKRAKLEQIEADARIADIEVDLAMISVPLATVQGKLHLEGQAGVARRIATAIRSQQSTT